MITEPGVVVNDEILRQYRLCGSIRREVMFVDAQLLLSRTRGALSGLRRLG